MRTLGLIVTLGLAGCNHWVEVQTPVPQVLEEVPPPRLRLATASGESLVMVGARVYGDSIAGQVERQSGGEAVMSALLGATIKHRVPGTVAVRDVVRVEARRPDPTATAALAVGVGAGLVTMLVVIAKFNSAFGGSGNALIYRFTF
ncbi:MAG TPA: hypothetical protein VGQ69_00475 [Gemmatimonadales bacterium]|jgi:hypothetical protein|nr:hypothetical protein [Gemmatimonadales bacterium]